MARIVFKIVFIIVILALIGGGGWFGYGKVKQYRENNSKKVSILALSESSNPSDNTINSGQEATAINGSEENTENIQQIDNVSKDIAKEGADNKTAKTDIKKSNNNDDENKTKSQSAGKTKVNLISWGYKSTNNRKIDTIIVHSSYDALGGDVYDVEGILKEYKQYGVSAHYLIGRDGTIWQLVAEKNIAYHAGESSVPDGRTGVNNFSIGIEMVNTEKDNYTDDQYSALNSLIVNLKKKYSIKYVLGHKDIAPGRKTDPWGMDWSKVDK